MRKAGLQIHLWDEFELFANEVLGLKEGNKIKHCELASNNLKRQLEQINSCDNNTVRLTATQNGVSGP
jgi:hypothetical protein